MNNKTDQGVGERNDEKAAHPTDDDPWFSILSAYYSLPISILMVREKSYCLQIVHQLTPETDAQMDEKKANRGGVTRARLKNYTIEDFEAMCQPKTRKEIKGLVGFSSKNFQLYQTSFRRQENCAFSRKRCIFSSGISTPYFYHLNQCLNDADKDRIKRLKMTWSFVFHVFKCLPLWSHNNKNNQ